MTTKRICPTPSLSNERERKKLDCRYSFPSPLRGPSLLCKMGGWGGMISLLVFLSLSQTPVATSVPYLESGSLSSRSKRARWWSEESKHGTVRNATIPMYLVEWCFSKRQIKRKRAQWIGEQTKGGGSECLTFTQSHNAPNKAGRRAEKGQNKQQEGFGGRRGGALGVPTPIVH